MKLDCLVYLTWIFFFFLHVFHHRKKTYKQISGPLFHYQTALHVTVHVTKKVLHIENEQPASVLSNVTLTTICRSQVYIQLNSIFYAGQIVSQQVGIESI